MPILLRTKRNSALSPASGPPTTPITVNGTGFGASEGITITFEAKQVATATTDASGAFSATFTLSKSAFQGPGL